jgi:uncharacterized membrane protein YjjB (DUF3815 family)
MVSGLFIINGCMNEYINYVFFLFSGFGLSCVCVVSLSSLLWIIVLSCVCVVQE